MGSCRHLLTACLEVKFRQQFLHHDQTTWQSSQVQASIPLLRPRTRGEEGQEGHHSAKEEEKEADHPLVGKPLQEGATEEGDKSVITICLHAMRASRCTV